MLNFSAIFLGWKTGENKTKIKNKYKKKLTVNTKIISVTMHDSH